MNCEIEYKEKKEPAWPPASIGLWCRWVLSNTIAGAVGLFLGTFPLYAFLRLVNSNRVWVTPDTTPFYLDAAQRPVALAALFIGISASFGFSMGVVQSRILTRHVKGWRHWVWIWLSIAGIGSALLLLIFTTMAFNSTLSPDNLLRWLVPGILGGATFGFLQWLALRKYTRDAYWWIPANALGWGMAAMVIVVSRLIVSTIRLGALPWYISAIIISLFLVAPATFTGIFLARSRRPISNPLLTPYTPSQPPHSTSPN